ncbi:Ribonuclease H2, subunit C [Phaffia rhodozyma]|uniref:Ribonuclease H2, subunit C n=1 Tax=Phaffia rhodozyma TaxID=264483 RepID=A0A0F7SYC6_PHARH|nr:Ribonuclease H2, subunit C [Phaffia rhodozyma]
MSQQRTTIVHPLSPLSVLPQPPSLLPFHIDYIGPAPVSTYLLTRPAPSPSSGSTSTLSSSSDSLLLSSFRGRQIVGQPLVLPSNYEGYILDVPPPPSTLALSSGPSLKDPSQRGTTFGQASLRLDKTQSTDQPRKFARTRSATKRFFSEQEVTPSSTEAPSFRAKQLGAKKQKVAAKKFKLESDSEEDIDGEEEAQEIKAVPTAIPIETTSSTWTVSTVVTDSDSNVNTQEDEQTPLSTISNATALSSVDATGLTATDATTTVHSTLPSTDMFPSSDQPIDSKATQDTLNLCPSSVPSVLHDIAPSDPLASLPSEEIAEDEGDIHDVNLDAEDDAELYTPPGPPPRELVPTHTFKQITIWTADDPVDRARDEFFRCFDVGGWIDLAKAIHAED